MEKPDLGKISHPRFHRELIFPFIVLALLLLTGFLAGLVYRSYLWPAFLAVFLFVGFYRFNQNLRNWLAFTGFSRDLAATISLIVVTVIILGPALYILQLLVEQAIQLFYQVRDLLTGDRIFHLVYSFPSITETVTSYPFFWVNIQTMINNNLAEAGSILDPENVGNYLANAYNFLLGSVTLTLNLTVSLIFSLILLYFLFRDGDRIYTTIRDSLPIDPAYTSAFAKRMKEILSAILKGNIFVSFLQGVAVFIGLTICDIPNAILYAAIASVFSLVPVIGTAPVWLPAAVYLGWIHGQIGCAIFLIVFGEGMYLFLENIFKPMILDRRLGIHPVMLFFAILGGIKEFGMSGVIVGPLLVALFMTVWNLYRIWESGPPESFEKHSETSATEEPEPS